MKASSKKCCEGDIDCLSPDILSEKATNELRKATYDTWGEDLFLVVAITKQGNTVRLLPFDTKDKSIYELDDENEATEILEIFVDIPVSMNCCEEKKYDR